MLVLIIIFIVYIVLRNQAIKLKSLRRIYIQNKLQINNKKEEIEGTTESYVHIEKDDEKPSDASKDNVELADVDNFEKIEPTSGFSISGIQDFSNKKIDIQKKQYKMPLLTVQVLMMSEDMKMGKQANDTYLVNGGYYIKCDGKTYDESYKDAFDPSITLPFTAPNYNNKILKSNYSASKSNNRFLEFMKQNKYDMKLYAQFFTKSNYQGTKLTLCYGYYADLKRSKDDDYKKVHDDIESIKIPSTMSVICSINNTYKGDKATYNKNIQKVSNRKISSLQILETHVSPADDFLAKYNIKKTYKSELSTEEYNLLQCYLFMTQKVRLFQSENGSTSSNNTRDKYNQWCDVYAGEYSLIKDTGFNNDRLIAVKVPKGFKLTYYKDSNFGGGDKVVVGDDKLVVLEIKNWASSLKVTFTEDILKKFDVRTLQNVYTILKSQEIITPYMEAILEQILNKTGIGYLKGIEENDKNKMELENTAQQSIYIEYYLLIKYYQ